jgi:hypothetical protein
LKIHCDGFYHRGKQTGSHFRIAVMNLDSGHDVGFDPAYEMSRWDHSADARKKIETDPSSPKYLLTEPWVAYRLELGA